MAATHKAKAARAATEPTESGPKPAVSQPPARVSAPTLQRAIVTFRNADGSLNTVSCSLYAARVYDATRERRGVVSIEYIAEGDD